MSSPLFTYRPIPVIAEMLAERGIDAAELIRSAGLPEEAIRGEITAPLNRIEGFLDAVAKRLDAPLFALDLADRVPRGTYGVTEFVVRAAPSVQHGLAALCELAPLINPQVEMRYVADHQGCEIHHTFAALRDALGMHLNEYTVAFVAKSFASVLGRPLPLERAWFAHSRRDHADDVARRLGCHVTFQAADCGFAVASDVIAFVPESADAPLFAFLTAQARAQLDLLGKNDVIAQVVRAVESRLTNADLSAASIASALATTQRSLQRHLAEAGTSYRDVLAHVRQRRRAELERAGVAEAEIAPRLGFANARTMRRSLDDTGPDEEAND